MLIVEKPAELLCESAHPQTLSIGLTRVSNNYFIYFLFTACALLTWGGNKF